MGNSIVAVDNIVINILPNMAFRFIGCKRFICGPQWRSCYSDRPTRETVRIECCAAVLNLLYVPLLYVAIVHSALWMSTWLFTIVDICVRIRWVWLCMRVLLRTYIPVLLCACAVHVYSKAHIHLMCTSICKRVIVYNILSTSVRYE